LCYIYISAFKKASRACCKPRVSPLPGAALTDNAMRYIYLYIQI
jgi:hypothetical protein